MWPFCIDRDDFRKDIDDTRSKIGISTLPYVLPKFPYKSANNVANYIKGNMFNLRCN